MAGVLILVVLTKLSIYAVNGKIENVALNKNTSASPSYRNWPARQAVDGDSDVNGESRTCYHALPSPSFWTVDLGRDYQLYDIKVYLRRLNLDRTANSIIYLDNDQSRVCFTFPSKINDSLTSVTCNDTARYVTIRNPGNGPGEDDALNICEVVINGCSSGTFGMDCLNNCRCSYCYRWSGICYTDCYTGWTGKRCDIECSNDTYGINCVKRCADRKCTNNSSSCDQITGSCDSSGCQPGWKDDDCHKECRDDYYGSDCSSRCADRHCYGKSSCNHVTGSCDKGCQAGWKRLDCAQSCDREHYGPDCTGVCASRHCEGGSSCNSTTGMCDQGCQSGWKGKDCIDTFVLNTFTIDAGGDSTPIIVGTVVGMVLLVVIILLLIVLIRRKKNRDTSGNKIPSQSVKVQDQGSEVMQIHTIYVEGYDALDVMSRDQGNTDNTYTMIDSFENDDGRGKVAEDALDVLSDVTFQDASERKVDGTYDNLDKNSHNQYGDYTRIEKSDSYEIVKIPNK